MYPSAYSHMNISCGQRCLKNRLTAALGVGLSENEIKRLQKIAILRKLGLSIPDIQSVLDDNSEAALYNVSNKKSLEIKTLKTKQELTQKLAQSQDWNHICLQLEMLENKQSILERLIDVFPGISGRNSQEF